MKLNLIFGTLIALVVLAVAAGILFPLWAGVAPPRHNRALVNLKQISIGIHMYSADQDGGLPLALVWATSTKPYAKQADSFVLPEHQAETGKYGVAFMTKLSGIRLADPRQTMLFESIDGSWNAHHNFTEVWWHQDRKTAIAFADGHAKAFRQDDPNVPAKGTGLSP